MKPLAIERTLYDSALSEIIEKLIIEASYDLSRIPDLEERARSILSTALQQAVENHHCGGGAPVEHKNPCRARLKQVCKSPNQTEFGRQLALEIYARLVMYDKRDHERRLMRYFTRVSSIFARYGVKSVTACAIIEQDIMHL